MTAPSALQSRFLSEMGVFIQTADAALTSIASDPQRTPQLLESFAEWMVGIRGTALQLGYSRVSELAGLGEEIAIRAAEPGTSRALLRKSVGCLWDALTTLRYALSHPDEATSTEEQEILLQRLRVTLKSLGGAREKVSPEELSNLLASFHRPPTE
jgi:hypothetical protein